MRSRKTRENPVNNKKKTGSKIAEVTTRLVDVLEPLESDERRRAISAALTLLGEIMPEGEGGPNTKGNDKAETRNSGPTNLPEGLSAKASNWVKQNNLTTTQIEQVFDITAEGATVIASEMPGKSKREQTHNAYVLQGLSRFLASGDPSFDDKSARKVCEDSGCYDRANHSTIMGDIGNLVTGSKKTGWKLTAPGLKRGAELVKQLSQEA